MAANLLYRKGSAYVGHVCHTRVTWSSVLAKDGSIHRAPICDMVLEGYHHSPGNGLILRFKFSGHSKKFVLFIYIFMVSEVHGFNTLISYLRKWLAHATPLSRCYHIGPKLSQV